MIENSPGYHRSREFAAWIASSIPSIHSIAGRSLRTLTTLLVLVFACWPAAATAETWLAFDGKNDAVTSRNVKITNAVTVEAWIRPATIPSTRSQSRIVSKNAPFELMISTGDTGCHFGTSGHVQWRSKIGGVDRRICGGVLTPSVWQHVAGTYNGSRFRLYINGKLVADVARSGTLATNAQNITLGNRPLLDRAFHGDLDEIRIWSRGLAQTEIQTYMNAIPVASASGLEAWYRLNEGSGQSAFDSSARARTAILGTASGADTSDPAWRTVPATGNQPPVVNAGSNQTISADNPVASLHGTVSDDGLPTAALTTAWSLASGPAAVTFQNPYALSTIASFPTTGSYVLRLSASDGELSSSSTVTISVASVGPGITSIILTPSVVSLAPGAIQQFSAEGRDPSGPPVAIAPVWSATGGSINQAGRYAAGSVTGQYTVTANSNGVSGQATVLISTATNVWPGSAWATATPLQLGMTAARLNEARDYALTGGGSGFITRHGKLALSWGDTKLLYDLKSSTKSLGGTTLGIALGDGLVRIDDVAQLHLPWIGMPPDTNAATGWLDDIQLLHLATHTSGFAKPGGYEAIQFMPGTKWQYSDGGANWLADLLTVRFGKDLNAVLFSRALTPIGVTSADLKWRNNAYRVDTINGIKSREFGSGIRANVDAMARIGYLYLRRGNWNGQHVLPESYIDLVSRPHPHLPGLPVVDAPKYGAASNRYGVLWWTNANGDIAGVPPDAYWSWGLQDSLVIVIPSLDIAVARAGNGWRVGWNPDYAVLAPFLQPIAKSVSSP